MFRARQIKAARALLGWTGEDLAKATGLSITTVRNLEAGESPRNATTKIVRETLERKGIEFLDNDGVRCRRDTLKIYQGLDSLDLFYDDLLREARGLNGDILITFKSLEIMNKLCSTKSGKLGRLEQISKYADIKCILPDAFDPLLTSSTLQVRSILRQHIGSSTYFVFGNRYAIVSAPKDDRIVFIVFNSANEADEYRKHFYSLWELAPSVLAQYLKLENQVTV